PSPRAPPRPSRSGCHLPASWCPSLYRSLRDQSISDARLGQDVARLCGNALDLPPHVRHVHVEVVVLVRVSTAPHLLEQLIASEDLAGMMGKRREQPVLDWREVDLLILHQDSTMREIDLELADAERLLVRSPAQPLGAPERDAHACEQFAHAEGLADV